MVRIRPSTLADHDVFLSESLVHETGGIRLNGLVIECSGTSLALVEYGFTELPVSRGNMGWALGSSDSSPSRCVRIELLRVARETTVSRVFPLMRAVQNVALEHAIEWVSVLPRVEPTDDIVDLQSMYQRGEITHPLCALLWEAGFVDIIEGHLLNFLWRNPAF